MKENSIIICITKSRKATHNLICYDEIIQQMDVKAADPKLESYPVMFGI